MGRITVLIAAAALAVVSGVAIFVSYYVLPPAPAESIPGKAESSAAQAGLQFSTMWFAVGLLVIVIAIIKVSRTRYVARRAGTRFHSLSVSD